MNKLVSLVMMGLLGLVVLTAAGPIFVKLVNSLVPLVVVAGIVIAVLRVVWYLTNNQW